MKLRKKGLNKFEMILKISKSIYIVGFLRYGNRTVSYLAIFWFLCNLMSLHYNTDKFNPFRFTVINEIGLIPLYFGFLGFVFFFLILHLAFSLFLPSEFGWYGLISCWFGCKKIHFLCACVFIYPSFLTCPYNFKISNTGVFQGNQTFVRF